MSSVPERVPVRRPVRPGDIVRRAVAVVAIAALSAACGSDPEAAEPTTLRVVMADDWATAALVGEVVDAFEAKHPGVRVHIQPSPFSQIPDLVTEATELGQPYDLAHWHAFAAAATGDAEPLDDLWEAEGLRAEDYLPGAMDDVAWDGQIYGVPLDVNALVLMANADQLRSVGLEAEDLRTSSGFREAAARLRDDSEAEHAIAVTSSSWAAYGWIAAGGGRLIDGTDAHGLPRFTFTDPHTIEAVDLLVDLIASGDAPPPFAPDLSMDAVASFNTGETALHVSGSWDLPVTRRALQAEGDVDDVLILPLPQLDPTAPRTVLGGSSLYVPRGAEQRDLAFDLMLALTADPVAIEFAAQEGRLPARASAYEAPLFASSPELIAFVDQLPDARVMPLIAYPEVAAAFRDGLEGALAQRTTAADAMASVQRFAEDWIEEQRVEP